jgi:hypothetical protein
MANPDPTAPRRAFTSTRARVSVNGTIIGWVNDFSASESFGNVPIRVFGDAAVQLFETVAYNVNGSFGYMHLLNEPLNAVGGGKTWFPLNWDADRESENRKIIDYLPGTIELLDWYSGKAVLRISGFKPEGRVFRLSEGAITMVNATFVATTLTEFSVPTR